MKKTLLLLSAFVMLFVARISAQEVWHIVTSDEQYIPVNKMAYLAQADDAEGYIIVQNNGAIVATKSVFFRYVPLALERVESSQLDLSVFPNPVVSTLTLGGLQDATVVYVRSIEGATVIHTTLSPDNTTLNVSGLAAGVYLLQVNNTTVKFIKK